MKRVKQFARLFTGNPSLLNRIDQNARDFSKALTRISEEYPSGFLDMKNLDSQELMRGLSDLLEHQGKDLYIGEYHEQWDQEHINFYYKRRDFLGPYLQKDSQWILGTVNDWLSTFDIRERFCQFSDGKDLHLTTLLSPETIHAVQTHFQETPLLAGPLTFTEPSYEKQRAEESIDSFARVCLDYDITSADLKPFLDPSSYHSGPDPQIKAQYSGPDPQTKAQKYLRFEMTTNPWGKWRQMLEGLKERLPYLFQDPEEKQPFYGDLNKQQALEEFAKIFVKEPLIGKFKSGLTGIQLQAAPTFSEVSDLLAEYGFLQPSTFDGCLQAGKLLEADGLSFRMDPGWNLTLEKTATQDISQAAWQHNTIEEVMATGNHLIEYAGYDSRFCQIEHAGYAFRSYTRKGQAYLTVLTPEETDRVLELTVRFPDLAKGFSFTKPTKEEFPSLGDALDALDSEEQMDL